MNKQKYKIDVCLKLFFNAKNRLSAIFLGSPNKLGQRSNLTTQQPLSSLTILLQGTFTSFISQNFLRCLSSTTKSLEKLHGTYPT